MVHTATRRLPAALVERAEALDAADPLAHHANRFVRSDGVRAYLDGNSLGRPLRVTQDRLAAFVGSDWGDRLIRAWDERWMDQPTALGDRVGAVVLGAAASQTVVADSTTVLLYKLVTAALDASPGRPQVVADTENFPTDRYILESVASRHGAEVVWISPDPARGVTLEDVENAVSERTALVALSHVAYKSAHIADLPAITAAAHAVGALVLWDLCHSAGAVALDLDAASVDLAVGCTYKYLNGGPGAPAFGYVATAVQGRLEQPIAGWMGHAEPFAMAGRYEPAPGIRRFLSGTPPILGMIPVEDMLDLIDEATLPAIRAKSVALTTLAIDIADTVLAPLGVTLASPRDPESRGGHVMLEHPTMAATVARLWEEGVIPDFRPPVGLRAGMSPLSTQFSEVAFALDRVAALVGAATA